MRPAIQSMEAKNRILHQLLMGSVQQLKNHTVGRRFESCYWRKLV